MQNLMLNFHITMLDPSLTSFVVHHSSTISIIGSMKLANTYSNFCTRQDPPHIMVMWRLHVLQLLAACAVAAAGGIICCAKRFFDTAAGMECSSKMLAVASFTASVLNVTTSCTYHSKLRHRPPAQDCTLLNL